MTEINFSKIEAKWQKEWEAKKIFEVKEDSKKKKFYCLEMFPYPSGAGLHMGHALNYTIGDIYARFKRMSGFNVLYPMGYDAFGLPAENAAIKAGEHPKKYTENSMANFMKQQKLLGLSYDWSRKVVTCYPEYYKWNQYFFLKFLEAGLVYRKKSAVNWCPKCNTVLANEQVHQGKCWRHEDTDVEIKQLEQWFIKTTDYAEELLEKVDELKWPERIKTMQKNWIGKSHGIEIDFEIENSNEKNQVSNVVIVHGANENEASSKKGGVEITRHWFPWLREELAKRKIAFSNELYPRDWNPSYNDWKKEFEKNKINKNTILVAHSLGCGFVLRWLTENKKKVKKVILVAPYILDSSELLGLKEMVSFTLGKNLDKLAEEFVVFHSDNDYPFILDSVCYLKENIHARFVERKGAGHFNKSNGFVTFPELLDEIVSTKKWPIFTTRPDTIYGVTFLVVSAQHPRLMELVTEKQKKEVEKFLKKLKSVSEKEMEEMEKEGVFTGSYAINPATGTKIPIWAANFVIADYGSGMVMADAHDQRDLEFAHKYKINLIETVLPESGVSTDPNKSKRAFTDYGVLVNSGQFTGLKTKEAIEKISDFLEKKKFGKRVVNYKLRDWLISRQRYWGTPIPVVYCDECKKQIEKNSFELHFREKESFENILNGKKTIETRALNPEEKQGFFGNIKQGNYLKCVNKTNNQIIFLEVLSSKIYKNLNELFKDKEKIKKIFPDKNINSIDELKKCYAYTKDYLGRIEKNGLISWEIKVVIPGIVPVPEKDLPVELPEKVEFGEGNPLATNGKFVNVKCPKCNAKARRETDTMDTFFDSSWYFLRYCDNKDDKKPFDKKKVGYWMPVDQYIGGAEHACMHLIYARFFTKALRDLGFFENQKNDASNARFLDARNSSKEFRQKIDEPFTSLFNQGMLHGSDGNKMSKSLGNVVLPEEVSKNYGIDTARMFLISVASPDSDIQWSEKGIEGSLKFMKKTFQYFEKVKIGKSGPKTESKLNKIIKEVTNQIENFKYNLAMIKVRELFDSLPEETSKEVLEKSLKLLSPFCPHVAEELWHKLGNKTFISVESWPVSDEKKINSNFEQAEQAVEKLVQDINSVKQILKERENKETKKVFVYVMPQEKKNFADSVGEIEKRTSAEVKIFAVNDKDKYDPEEKSKKAKPGKPGIYLE